MHKRTKRNTVVKPLESAQANQEKSNRLFRGCIILLLLLAYGFLVTSKINLSTADLGRHLKNGEIFFQEFLIPDTNLYSYTHTEYPFVNHHWGTGILFFLIWKVSGFGGLSIFFVLLSLSTFLLFFDSARRNSRFATAALCSAVLIPLMATRREIRPEALSYLFCGVFFWLLSNYKSGRTSFKSLLILPLLEILWVNTHIYFFMGIMLTGVFLLEFWAGWFLRKNKEMFRPFKEMGIIMIICCTACFFNPFGFKGALAPFNIFQDYGYRLFENQSVWFLERIVTYPPILFFKIGFGMLFLSLLVAAVKKGLNFPISDFILALIFSVMGWLAVRNFTIFALFAVPLCASNINVIFNKSHRLESPKSVLLSAALILIAMFSFNRRHFLAQRAGFGIGLSERVNGAGEFFKKENLRGPILNNYDIGSYLIYHLYPSYRVFVDNRPEAYPSSFFKDVYTPLMEDESKWLEAERGYGFNCIFFFRHDQTPWGQKFLIRRAFDPEWAAVYVDAYNIVLVKRIEQNKSIIEKFEIPKELFSIRRPR